MLRIHEVNRGLVLDLKRDLKRDLKFVLKGYSLDFFHFPLFSVRFLEKLG